jgi:hypothetical protein
VNINRIALNGDRISLGIDPNAYGSADAPKIFPVSTKEGIGGLRVIKDDLL